MTSIATSPVKAERNGFIRRHRKSLAFLTAGGVLMGGGVAWALYMLSLGLQGNLGPGAEAAWEFTSKGLQDNALCESGTGKITVDAAGTSAVITQSGQFPNDGCNFAPNVNAKGSGDNTGDLKLLGVFPTNGSSQPGSLPTGWTMEQITACGTVIPKSLSTGPGQPIAVQFRLETVGTTTTDPFYAEIKAVPTSQWSADLCPAGAPVQ